MSGRSRAVGCRFIVLMMMSLALTPLSSMNPAFAVPANDSFANATAISGSTGAVNGDVIGASTEAGEPTPTATSATAWYFWTAAATGPVTLDTCTSNFDTVLSSYTGSSVAGLSLIASNDDTAGCSSTNLGSRITFNAVACAVYRIQVGVYNSGTTGTFTLRWAQEGGAPCAQTGQIKVCKVAGPGVTVGESFTFGGYGGNVVVAAGPAPGGYCKVVGTFPVGSNVIIDEVLPSNAKVSIAVAPASNLVGTPNLVDGSVLVNVGVGVTEVIFTNRRTGFIEICKESGSPAVSGSFDFTVNGQTFAVPVGVCSGPIELPIGPNLITETFRPGTVLAGCSTVPAIALTSCDTPSRSAVVNVTAGGIAAQVLVTFTNRAAGDVLPPVPSTSTTVPPKPTSTTTPPPVTTTPPSTTIPTTVPTTTTPTTAFPTTTTTTATTTPSGSNSVCAALASQLLNTTDPAVIQQLQLFQRRMGCSGAV